MTFVLVKEIEEGRSSSSIRVALWRPALWPTLKKCAYLAFTCAIVLIVLVLLSNIPCATPHRSDTISEPRDELFQSQTSTEATKAETNEQAAAALSRSNEWLKKHVIDLVRHILDWINGKPRQNKDGERAKPSVIQLFSDDAMPVAASAQVFGRYYRRTADSSMLGSILELHINATGVTAWINKWAVKYLYESKKLCPDNKTQLECAKVRFHIYTQARPEGAEIEPELSLGALSSCGGGDVERARKYHFDLDALKAVQFEPEARTIVLVHGYLTENVDFLKEGASLWRQLEPSCNVIIIDWSAGSFGDYWQVAKRTPLVARQTTMLLHYLAQLSATSLYDAQFARNLHLVGHSLGAHIAGYVGQDLHGTVGRITGLDPAGPEFDKLDLYMRLDKQDAQLVDILHTNAGKFSVSGVCKGAACEVVARSHRDSIDAQAWRKCEYQVIGTHTAHQLLRERRPRSTNANPLDSRGAAHQLYLGVPRVGIGPKFKWPRLYKYAPAAETWPTCLLTNTLTMFARQA